MTRNDGRDRAARTAGGYDALANSLATLLDLSAVSVLVGEGAGAEFVACTAPDPGRLIPLMREAGLDAISRETVVRYEIPPSPYLNSAAGRIIALPFRAPSGMPGAVCAWQDGGRTCTDAELRLIRELAMTTAREAAATDRARSLEAVIETQHECVQVVAADGTVLNMNPAGLTVLGRKRLRDVIGADFRQFLAPAHRRQWESAQAAVMRGEEQSIEVRITDQFGGLRWVAMHMVPFRDGRGAIAASLSVMADVDDRHVAEDAVVRYLTTLRGTLEATADGILVTDADGRITAHNRRFCRKWGLDDDTLAADALDELWIQLDERLDPVDQLAALRARFQAEPTTSECAQLQLADGRTFEVVSQPQLLDGAVAGRVWSFRDQSDRVAAERALRRSEEQFRSIIENTADVVFATDTDARILYISPSVERILGHRPADLVGRVCLELAHPDDLPAAADALQRALANQDPLELRVRARARDGTWRHLGVVAQTMTGEDGAPVVVANARDVTELEAAQRELQASNETLSRLLAAMPVAVVGLDAEGLVRMWNRTAERTFGYTPDEVLGKPFTLVHPAHREQHDRAVEDTLSHRPIEGMETVHLRKDGTPLDVAIWSSVVQCSECDGGQIAVGLIVDITEKKRVENRLRRNEQRFRALVENALDVIVMLDANGTIRFGSPSGERLLGFGLGELRGVSIVDLIHPDDMSGVMSLMQAARSNGMEARMIDVRVRHVDGSYRMLEGLAKLLRDDEGNDVSGVIVNARDITARRELEAQLRQAQKMEAIGQFAGGVAHDFNNMLTAIKGFAILLEGGCDQESERDVYVHEIRKAAERAASLTQQLLAFSRKQILQPQVVDMNVVVLEMRGMLQRLIGADIDLRCSLEPNLRAVLADPSQVEQVIMNLAVNARDAMNSGGVLELVTANRHFDRSQVRALGSELPAGEYVMLAVIDNGCGMDDDMLGRIFDPFFTTKAVGKGTGLGLSTVYGIITQSGGFVDVSSRPGSGTRFEIYLPAAGHTCEVRTVPATSPAPQVASGSVLLVDDEPGVRLVARRILERAGYNVTEAASASQALTLLRDGDAAFDVVLSDVIMPGMTGPELAGVIAAEMPHLPLVLMSGYSDQESLPRGVGGLDCTYLGKPFDPAELRTAIATALDGSAPHASARTLAHTDAVG